MGVEAEILTPGVQNRGKTDPRSHFFNRDMMD